MLNTEEVRLNPIPRDFWRRHFETRRDVLEALERMEQFGNLPPPLWQAWVWHETGIATALLAWDMVGKKWRLLAPLSKLPGGGTEPRAAYLFVSEICQPEAAWVRCVGVPTMAQMLSYLDDDQERQNGWNALNRVTAGDAPNVPELRQKVSALSAAYSMEPPKLALVSTEPQKAEASDSGLNTFFGERE